MHNSPGALAAVKTILVAGHEDTGATAGIRALLSQTGELVALDLVELHDGELDGLMLVLDLLGGGVSLLLALLATTTQAEDQVEGALLLNVVVTKGAAIFQLLAGEDEALLIRGDT